MLCFSLAGPTKPAQGLPRKHLRPEDCCTWPEGLLDNTSWKDL